MTIDQFMRRSGNISDRLSKIVSHREQLHWDGALHPVDRAFRDLLSAQEQLLNAAEQVLDGLCAEAANEDSDDSGNHADLPSRKVASWGGNLQVECQH